MARAPAAVELDAAGGVQTARFFLKDVTAGRGVDWKFTPLQQGLLVLQILSENVSVPPTLAPLLLLLLLLRLALQSEPMLGP